MPRLKCDRQSPCDQCEKRDIAAACQFIPYETKRPPEGAADIVRPTPSPVPPRPKPQLSEQALQTRLKHLERLIQVLRSQRRDHEEDAQVSEDHPPEIVEMAEKAGLRPGDQRYLDGASWESIMEEVGLCLFCP